MTGWPVRYVLDREHPKMGPFPFPLPCPACGSRATPVEVHGHLQCQECRTVTQRCCEGAPGG